jgi:hypothetical protein
MKGDIISMQALLQDIQTLLTSFNCMVKTMIVRPEERGQQQELLTNIESVQSRIVKELKKHILWTP